MPYSIALRSRTDPTITGWYDGSKWSTDHNRRKFFEKKRRQTGMPRVAQPLPAQCRGDQTSKRSRTTLLSTWPRRDSRPRSPVV